MNLIKRLFKFGGDSDFGTFTNVIISIIGAVIIIMGWHCISAYNVELSRRRAQSVANYLVKEYGFDKNRFIIVGNGPKRAVEDKVVGSNNAYRTTDFQLVTE